MGEDDLTGARLGLKLWKERDGQSAQMVQLFRGHWDHGPGHWTAGGVQGQRTCWDQEVNLGKLLKISAFGALKRSIFLKYI